MKAHFVMFARYNAWANARLYDAAAALPDEACRRNEGAFFGSLHGTLNHILVADVIWMARFRGAPNPPWPLDHVPHDAFADLRAAREAQDADILAWIDDLPEDAFQKTFTYRTIVKPADVTQPLGPALTHFFNHQTHHRGQAHALLTRLAGAAPSFDLIQYQREAA